MTLGGMETATGVASLFANVVTANYFRVLGAVRAAGRLLTDGDSEAPGASPLAVLSHRCWMRQFNRDPAVVGRSVTINGTFCPNFLASTPCSCRAVIPATLNRGT